MGVPPNHPFIDGFFHYKPSIWGYHLFWKAHIYIYVSDIFSPLYSPCIRRAQAEACGRKHRWPQAGCWVLRVNFRAFPIDFSRIHGDLREIWGIDYRFIAIFGGITGITMDFMVE